MNEAQQQFGPLAIESAETRSARWPMINVTNQFCDDGTTWQIVELPATEVTRDGELVRSEYADEIEAYARLFAAAPELLHVVEEAIRLYELYAIIAQPHPTEGLAAGRWINQCRDVVVKVKGGEA